MSVVIGPVCSGSGLVPPNFYAPLIANDSSTAVPPRVPCHSCGGTGVIRETVYPPVYYLTHPSYVPPYWYNTWRDYS